MSIAERAGETSTAVTVVTEPDEHALLLKLATFGDVLSEVTADARAAPALHLPLRAGRRSTRRFYEACPVLKAPTPEQRASRLAMCALTADTLEDGPRAARHHRAGPDVVASLNGEFWVKMTQK